MRVGKPKLKIVGIKDSFDHQIFIVIGLKMRTIPIYHALF